MEKIALRSLILIVRCFTILARSTFVTAMIIGGVSLICYAFMDTPPWYSAPSIIFGLCLVFLGDKLVDADIPGPVIHLAAAALKMFIVAVLFIFGFNVFCTAFMDQPPWYSALLLISGLFLMASGVALADAHVMQWWEDLTESAG